MTISAFKSLGQPVLETGSSTYTRTIDQDGRVTGITIVGADGIQTINYTYDAAGRITGTTDSNNARPGLTSSATNYSVSSASNRLQGRTGPAAQTYTYDAAGNLTGDGTFTYGYDARGRLVQVTSGGVTTSYAINGLGQRVSKSSASAMTIFVYDEAGHLIGEYGSTGSVIQETVWVGDLPVVVFSPLQCYVNPDHLGGPRSIVDRNGATVWKWDHDPFGNGAPTGSLTYNLRFPGQYFDSETGLYYNMARDYSPGLGRYIQSDPIGLRGGINTYAYVGNDPVNRMDLEGLEAATTPTWPGICLPWPVIKLSPQQWKDMKDFFHLSKDRCEDIEEKCFDECEKHLGGDPCGQGFAFTNCMKACMARHGLTYP